MVSTLPPFLPPRLYDRPYLYQLPVMMPYLTQTHGLPLKTTMPTPSVTTSNFIPYQPISLPFNPYTPTAKYSNRKSREHLQQKSAPEPPLIDNDVSVSINNKQFTCEWVVDNGITCGHVETDCHSMVDHILANHCLGSQGGRKVCGWINCSYRSPKRSNHFAEHIKRHIIEEEEGESSRSGQTARFNPYREA